MNITDKLNTLMACAQAGDTKPRSYVVRYQRDFRPGSHLDWRVHFYGDGHWVTSDGQFHSFRTEADAEAAGAKWVLTGK